MTVEYRTPAGEICGAQARAIDFDEPANNDWLAVNQFSVMENKHSRRPDLVLFVNGLPLAVLELKNAADEEATCRRPVACAREAHPPQTWVSAGQAGKGDADGAGAGGGVVGGLGNTMRTAPNSSQGLPVSAFLADRPQAELTVDHVHIFICCRSRSFRRERASTVGIAMDKDRTDCLSQIGLVRRIGAGGDVPGTAAGKPRLTPGCVGAGCAG